MSPTVVLTWASAIRTFSRLRHVGKYGRARPRDSGPPKITRPGTPQEPRTRLGRAVDRTQTPRTSRLRVAPGLAALLFARDRPRVARQARTPTAHPERSPRSRRSTDAQAVLDPEPGAAPSRRATRRSRYATSPRPCRASTAPTGAARRALLARPTDSPDPYGDTWKAQEATPLCSAHFCVHYVTTTDDAPDLTDVAPANGVPDFVEAVAATAEYSYSVENGPLGWPRAEVRRPGRRLLGRPTSTSPTSAPTASSATPPIDPGQKCTRSCSAYLVLDDDYSKAEFGYDDPGAAAAGDARPRVQPRAPVRPRRVPGRLAVRVDRDLGRGQGLPRRQRLPQLRRAFARPPRASR